MARVKTVKKAQKDQGACEKCGTALPVGSAYVHFKVGFRSKVKRVRCTQPACYPKPSELSASMMSDAYAAQEQAHEDIDSWDPSDEAEDKGLSDLEEILSNAAAAANDVASQYEDSISNAPMLEDSLREKVDMLEAWASELESPDLPQYDGDADDEDLPTCEHCNGSGKCDVVSADADDDCSECKANSLRDAECGLCDGTGKVGDPEDTDEDNADSLADWAEEARGAARDLVDSLEG